MYLYIFLRWLWWCMMVWMTLYSSLICVHFRWAWPQDFRKSVCSKPRLAIEVLSEFNLVYTGFSWNSIENYFGTLKAFLFFFSFFFFFFVFLGPYSRHMEVPRLGVESELQLLAYATATVTHDLSGVCDLHHSNGLSGVCDLHHSNARSLSRHARPEIKPATLWILVGFATIEPQWELPKIIFIWQNFSSYVVLKCKGRVVLNVLNIAMVNSFTPSLFCFH